jgi:hypothetical protein
MVRSACRLVGALGVVLASSLLFTQPAQGGLACPVGPLEIPCTLRPQDEVWLVSTRHLGGLPGPNKWCPPRLCYYRYDPACGFRPASASAFSCLLNPATITIVYVHGNRMSDQQVQRRGLMLYSLIACGAAADQPIRYVIWSWPSRPLPCRLACLRDVRVKYRRVPLQSYYLACWLSHLAPEGRVSVLGYSYGGRMILGALHLLHGGALRGHTLQSSCCPSSLQVRMALWAPASQSDWLLPGRPHEYALCNVERSLVVYNSLDPVLKRYDRVILSATGPALGHVGLCGASCGCSRITQIDAACIVGCHHDFLRYAASPYLMHCVRQIVLWE